MSARVEHLAEGVSLYLGDCTDVITAIRPRSVDLVLTDPPYTTPTAVSFGRETARSISDLSVQAFFMRACAEGWRTAGKPTLRLFVFCDDNYYPVLHTVFYSWPFRQMVVWDKGRIGMGRGFRRRHELIIHASATSGDLHLWPGQTSHQSLLTFAPVPNGERVHGAQKPLKLVEYLVRAGSSPGDVVLDPFMGSGTTGVAAVKLGRKFVGIESEPQFFDSACRRIADALGHPAGADASDDAGLFADVRAEPLQAAE
jgi:site-specific DNA-methyltransferase (adenine-specific)